jgi:COP9 signalosome complex subunit 3
VTEDHVKMVHFIDDEETKQPDLETRIFNIAAMNDRVARMDKLEGLNKDFQTKVSLFNNDCWIG